MNITYLLAHLHEAQRNLSNVSYTASHYDSVQLDSEVHAIMSSISFLSDRIKRGEFGGTVPA